MKDFLQSFYKIFYKCILLILLVLATYVTCCSIFNIYGVKENLKPFILILGSFTLIFALINLKKLFAKIPEKISNYIAFFGCILFFIGMVIFGLKVTSIPTYDLSNIIKQVNDMFATGRDFTQNTYFSYYSNNIPLAIIVYYIYSFGKILGFANLNTFAIIINCISITITAFFTYLTVKKLKDYKMALVTLVFFILNPIFYLYSSYYYTDTLCIPFAIISIYLYLLFRDTSSYKRKIIYLLLSGLLLAIRK